MNNDYVTRAEFQMLEKHMNTRFNLIESSLREVKNELKNDIKSESHQRMRESESFKEDISNLVDQKISANISNMKDAQNKWFIATILIVLGLAGRIFGVY
ncbi:hypothetical protein K2V62_05370 [Mammaliicoccus sciuri]|uniref:hypothetical protein n=1 Tax=Mammaliicoccus sciuri TaxID=1296 RepID=UPI001E4B5E59|nr:hypothetical protein [Mammaliicoccus sciuri]MCD8894122.1 hypothetical protein [Mammaliicoccus sciuri]MCD8912311.1 hypothetical protein [Mammaliicoccus sciuri]